MFTFLIHIYIYKHTHTYICKHMHSTLLSGYCTGHAWIKQSEIDGPSDNEHYFQNMGNSLTINMVDRNYSTIGVSPQMRTPCMFSFCFHLCIRVVSICTRTTEPWILSNKLYWGFYGDGVFVLERILGCAVLYWGLECTIKVYLFVNVR